MSEDQRVTDKPVPWDHWANRRYLLHHVLLDIFLRLNRSLTLHFVMLVQLVVYLLFDCNCSSLRKGSVLKHCREVSYCVITFKTAPKLTESQLLKCAPGGFRPQEVDENCLNDDPAAVHKEKLPTDLAQAYWVHVGSEELGSFASELEDSYASCSLSVREDLDKVGCY
jgi:hypothetical protein